MWKHNKQNTYEEKKITNYFMISKNKYRLCYVPNGNTKNVSVLLNYHITKFSAILLKIIQLGKYDTIRVYTKSIYIHKDTESNELFFNEMIVDNYRYILYDLDLIRSSQEESYSLFCVVKKISA